MFQKKDLDRNGVLTDQPVFTKTPWYIPTDKMAPKASLLIEEGLNELKNNFALGETVLFLGPGLGTDGRSQILSLPDMASIPTNIKPHPFQRVWSDGSVDFMNALSEMKGY